MRLVAVSYLNTKPFLEGLASEPQTESWEIRLSPPSQCAEIFANNQADVALVPVGSLPDLKNYSILDQFCIGADGAVNSVFLFAQEPIEQISMVYEDWHSRTSNGLCKILMRDHWKKNVQWLKKDDYFDEIQGDKAGVIIGDKAIPLISRFKYCYDLSAEWKHMTELPFAFAVWIIKSELINSEIPQMLKNCFSKGISLLAQVAGKWHNTFGLTQEAALTYFSESIDYRLDANKKKAILLYLEKLSTILHFQMHPISFVS
jgi:chorismate dehydratase